MSGSSAPSTIRVLSLDGGGIRGISNARLLEHLEDRLSGAIQDWFDVIAGTSTGALIAAGLAGPLGEGEYPQRAQLFVDAYRDAALDIFPHRRTKLRKLAALAQRSKPSPALERLLETYVGECRLADASTEVVIPAYDTRTRQAVLFTRTDARKRQNRGLLLADVARASAAAPSYLPWVPLSWNGQARLLADGGLFANDPALLTVLMLQGQTPGARIRVLSLGTGRSGSKPADDSGDAEPLGISLAVGGALQIVFDATASMAEQAVSQLLGADHLRINYLFKDRIPSLDDARPEALDVLLKAADREWKRQGDAIEAFVRNS